MKKLLIIIISSLMLYACSSETSFYDIVYRDMVRDSDVYEDVTEVLAVIESDDAEIGLAMLSTKYDYDVLVLCSNMYDKKGVILTKSHGTTDPVVYRYEDDKRIWSQWITWGDDLDHEYDSARDFDYHFGLIDGIVDDVKYDGKAVRSESVSFYYLDEDVSVTLWVLALEHDTDFDMNKLTY